MGAIVSLPLMPVTLLALCCGAAACLAICLLLGGTFSLLILTRATYAFMLLINLILLWVALLPFIVHRLEKATFGFINISCGADGAQCILFALVYRINCALGTLHLALAGLLAGVHSTTNPRAVLQNGMWRGKILVWLGLIAVNFLLIPDLFFVFYGNHIAIIFLTIFLGIGLILLVDFAHAWAETCLEKIEMEELTGEGDSLMWKRLLIGGTLTMYGALVVVTVLMYTFFCGSGCHMNQTAVTINMILAIIILLMLVNQTIQELNPHAGLAQLLMVVCYCTYLVMLAVALEPDDKFCNPLVRSRGTRTASIVVGALFTFLAVAYTTTRAAANLAFAGGSGAIVDDSVGGVSRPRARNEMRYQAIKQAVDEGLLPELALHEVDLYTDGIDEGDEEFTRVKYNYLLFHVIFFLATQYVATLLTINVKQDDLGDFVPVGRTYFALWVKICLLWVCFVLYGWLLVAPVSWPDRFGVQI